jgi:SAM-dependent methyltransferase
LSEIAAFTIGVEPSAAMLAQSSAVAPKASFIAGTAEALPIRSHAVDLATAAGSLNWVDLKRFFPEAVRVLQADGTLVVYDYHPGRDFLRSDLLTDWYSEFVRRFPPPPCFEIHPDRLGCEPYGLQIRDRENFEIGLSMTPGSYLEYVLTEIGVIQAIQGGTDPLAIRTWCENTLSLVFRKHSREVLFRGFIVYLKPA